MRAIRALRSEWAMMPLQVRLVIVLFVCLSLAYNLVTPTTLFEQHNPDELEHFRYVRIVASGHLPRIGESNGTGEAHHPPLYYLSCVPVYLLARPMGNSVGMRVCRCVSTLYGLLLLFIVFRVSRTIRSSDHFSTASVAFVALLPMFVAQSAAVSNDVFSALVAGIVIMLLIEKNTGVWTGAALGASLLSKPNLVPFVIVPFLFVGWRQATKLVLFGLLVASPWFLRNQLLYGDVLAYRVFHTLGADPRAVVTSDYILLCAWLSFASFWGVFDAYRVWWPPNNAFGALNVYFMLYMLSLVAVFGLLIPRRESGNWRLVIVVLLVLAIHASLLKFQFQPQGRLWFPAILPIAILFCDGWRRTVRGVRGFAIGSAAFAGLLFMLNVYTIAGEMIPKYGWLA